MNRRAFLGLLLASSASAAVFRRGTVSRTQYTTSQLIADAPSGYYILNCAPFLRAYVDRAGKLWVIEGGYIKPWDTYPDAWIFANAVWLPDPNAGGAQ